MVERPVDRNWALLFGTWLVALLSSAAVLFVGEVMGQAPCNLCWFQRAFMFPLAIVLGLASLRGDSGVWRYALALSVPGALVALFHSLVYFGLVAESITPCGAGVSCAGADMTVLGGLPLPLLALAAFSTMTLFLVLIRPRTSA